MEFIALANHRKMIRAEIAQSSRRFRVLQLEAVTEILARYDYRSTVYTPGALVLLMSSISRFLRMEEAFDIDLGHHDVTGVIEGILQELEGDRRPVPSE